MRTEDAREPNLDPALRRGWRYTLAGAVGGSAIDALMHTTRVHLHNPQAWRTHVEAGKPVIFALWHGRLMPLGFLHRGEGVVALASRSADGEYISRLLQHWGFGMVRGSSSRGGDTAFRDLIRTVRSGRSVAITPDGPRGPFQQMKPGIIQLAQMTGAPLIPVAVASSRAWWFVNWDRFMVPKPFASIHVAYGDGVHVPRDADAATIDAYAGRIATEIGSLMEMVEERASS